MSQYGKLFKLLSSKLMLNEVQPFRLLTPPGTPLFPSLEMESRKTVMSQFGPPTTRPTALKSRVSILTVDFRDFICVC